MTVDIYFESEFNQNTNLENEKIITKKIEDSQPQENFDKTKTDIVVPEKTDEKSNVPTLNARQDRFSPKRLLEQSFKQQNFLNALLNEEIKRGAELSKQASPQQFTELLGVQAKVFSAVALLMQSADKRMKFAVSQQRANSQKKRKKETDKNFVQVTVFGKLVYADATPVANAKIIFLGQERSVGFADINGRYIFESKKISEKTFELIVPTKNNSLKYKIENCTHSSYEINLILVDAK